MGIVDVLFIDVNAMYSHLPTARYKSREKSDWGETLESEGKQAALTESSEGWHVCASVLEQRKPSHRSELSPNQLVVI